MNVLTIFLRFILANISTEHTSRGKHSDFIVILDVLKDTNTRKEQIKKDDDHRLKEDYSKSYIQTKNICKRAELRKFIAGYDKFFRREKEVQL